MNLVSVPEPPTDNLYKFLALFGLALLLAGPYFWAQFQLQQDGRIMEALAALQDWNEVSHYETYLWRAQIQHGDQVTPDQRAAVDRVDELKKQSDHIGAEFLRFDHYHIYVNGIALFFFIGGAILSIAGFRLWYVRVQRPLDRRIRQRGSE